MFEVRFALLEQGAEVMSEEEFKFGEPLDESSVVPYIRQREVRYAGVLDKLKMLKPGEWLPVHCRSVEAARKLAIWANTHRTLKLKSNTMQCTVHLRFKTEQESAVPQPKKGA